VVSCYCKYLSASWDYIVPRDRATPRGVSWVFCQAKYAKFGEYISKIAKKRVQAVEITRYLLDVRNQYVRIFFSIKTLI
jgi:hypothetical protein